MADAALLHPRSVTVPPPELHEAVILDNATELGQEVRVEGAWLGSQLASDPMGWRPSYVTGAGEFWPKRGDRAVVTAHADGPPVIIWWEPATEREPDAAGGGDGLGVILHGSDPAVPRGTSHPQYIWIGTVTPENIAAFDLLAKYG